MANPIENPPTAPNADMYKRSLSATLAPSGRADDNWVDWLSVAANDRSVCKIQFVSDHSETGAHAPKGARCLGKILTETARRLNRSADCIGLRCTIRLRVVDTIHFDCNHPFLTTIVSKLISSAVFAKATKIEVFATEYDSDFFIQIADNRRAETWTDLPPQHMRFKHAIHCAKTGSVLRAVGLLIDVLGGDLQVVSSSAHCATRVGLKFPLSSEELTHH